MSALANRDFIKMNGLGNEIVIVDLRRAPNPILAAEARAAARQEPYDQLMALYPAGGNDASITAAIRIYNNDGSEAGACGNGMRCVAALIGGETGNAALKFETPGGIVSCWRADGGQFTVDMGEPRFALGRDSAGRGISPTPAPSNLKIGPLGAPILHSPSAVSMGNPHAIFWVDDRGAYDLAAIGPHARARSDVSRARQYHARGDARARSHRDPHLGARRRPDQGLRFGRLRRRRRRGAA